MPVLALLTAWLAHRVTAGWPHVPARGVMLHPFGVEVTYQSCGFHTGQDWFGSAGSPIYAVDDGLVVYVGPLWLRGTDVGRGDHAVVLDHGDHYTTYSHNRASVVTAGDRVRRGQRIAELGGAGYSGAPHLHLEMIRKAEAPWSGDWRRPFPGCDGYVDPGLRWAP